MKVYRTGRPIDHIHLIPDDLPASLRVYRAIFEAFGREIQGERETMFWSDEFIVNSPEPDVTVGRTHVHLAFQAGSRAMVDAFHVAGLAAGGRDNGAPGERSYRLGYYGAFRLDPDDNNIEAVYHGPSERSADAVTTTPRP